MGMFDHDAIVAGFKATVGSGQFDGAAIRIDEVLGEIRPPAVVIAPPGLEFAQTGEGWYVDAVIYPLHIFTAVERGVIRLQTHYAFLEAVLQELMDDPTLNGTVVGAVPQDAPVPEETEVTNRDGQVVRKMLRQIVSVRIDI